METPKLQIWKNMSVKMTFPWYFILFYLYAIFQQATQFSVGWFKWGPANNLQDIHFKTLHHIT